MKSAAGNVVWQLLWQSDGVTWVILGLLLLLSIACWSVVLYKWGMLRAALRRLSTVTQALGNARTEHELRSLADAYRDTMVGKFLRVGVSGLMVERWDEPVARQAWKDELAGEAERVVVQEEEYVSVLKTAADIAPLLGLLGTIWGLIHSFLGMAYERTADIVTVAPGIAEALITTLAGLAVAIPAVFFFHLIHSKLQELETAVWLTADTLEHAVVSLRQERP